MNIAIFVDCYYPRINGVVVSVKSYTDELVKKGHKVIIVCPDYEQTHKTKKTISGIYYDDTIELNKNVTILRIRSMNLIWSKEDKLARLDHWRLIKKQLDNFKPDVIHLNSEFTMGFYGLTYARRRTLPCVFTFHTLWEEYFADYSNFAPEIIAKKVGRDFTKFYLKRVDEIIVPTQRIGDVVDRYKVNKSYDILPTGIPNDISKYNKKYWGTFFNQLHKIFPVIKKKHILLYVGRIAKEKNLDFLVDVLGEVRKTINDAVLVFVGGGPYEAELKAYAKKKPYAWNICFAGYKTRDELSYLYNYADLFVFPSCTETQGLVTIEAMTCGLPVVAIGEMGTVDVMRGDNGGFMVHNDINEFSEKVCLLLSDKNLYEAKKKEAVEWSKQWSISTLTDKLISYYKKGIENHKKRSLLDE